ncbi:MAG: hypothetical protein U5R46_10970 [Gammaproteobacteria bacterium]|nr:hypothetical protein [Gammaproteobacteria bacterium]
MNNNQYDEPLNHQPPVEKPRSILFVCTGNICRGPMAAALFKRRRHSNCGCIVRSAGTDGRDGRPVHGEAQDVLHRRGIDMSRHASRIITPNLLPAFELILAMEESHREWIARHFPDAGHRTWWLGHWRNLELSRRTNGQYTDYERLADEIEQCIGDWHRRFAMSVAQSRPPTVVDGIPL